MTLGIIPPPIWLAVATAGWYVASRTLGSGSSEKQRVSAISFALPFATTCAAAIAMSHPEIAIGVALAGSVAALTLVLGLIGLTFPVSLVTPTRTRWLFLLPTGVVCLLIGLSGEIRIVHATLLLLQGIAVLLGSRGEPPSETAEARTSFRWTVAPFAIAAMIIASILAVRAADATSRDLQQSGDGVIAAVMLAPALALPMIGVTSRLAAERRSIEAIGLTINVVLINLCLLLPLSAIAWNALPATAAVFRPTSQPATMPATRPTSEPADTSVLPRQFVYPLTVWRIDTMLILVAGLFLLLLALGRIALGRAESTVLLLVYVVYLGLSAIVAR